MKNFSNIIIRLFIITLFVGFTGCNKDDDGDNSSNLTTSELLIGTWSVTDYDLEVLIGSQSLIDYLIEVEGLSEATGTLTLKSDNTYVSDFGEEGSTSGTWSLSQDEKTLTLTEGTDTIVLAIVSITSKTLKATISEASPEDLDGDPATPDVIISVDITLTLTK